MHIVVGLSVTNLEEISLENMISSVFIYTFPDLRSIDDHRP